MKTILLMILISTGITSMAQPGLKEIKEAGDYNFDGILDYRIKYDIVDDAWDFYIFNSKNNTFDRDSVLSNLDGTVFDFVNKKFQGSKIIQISELITQIDLYAYLNGSLIINERRICYQKFSQSERTDCYIYILDNGELIFKEILHGAE